MWLCLLKQPCFFKSPFQACKKSKRSVKWTLRDVTKRQPSTPPPPIVLHNILPTYISNLSNISRESHWQPYMWELLTERFFGDLKRPFLEDTLTSTKFANSMDVFPPSFPSDSSSGGTILSTRWPTVTLIPRTGSKKLFFPHLKIIVIWSFTFPNNPNNLMLSRPRWDKEGGGSVR